MRIIEKKEPEKWTLELTCQENKDEYGFVWARKENDFCGSKLEIDVDDIFFKTWWKMSVGRGKDYLVKCPVCQNLIYIKPDLIPSYIKKKVDQKGESNL